MKQKTTKYNGSLKHNYLFYNSDIIVPPTAPTTTIIQGGNFQYTNILNNTAAKAKSTGCTSPNRMIES